MAEGVGFVPKFTIFRFQLMRFSPVFKGDLSLFGLTDLYRLLTLLLNAWWKRNVRERRILGLL